MKSLHLKIATVTALIVWLALVATAIILIFGLYVATQIQPILVAPETQQDSTQELNVTDQTTGSDVTETTETEIKNDADLQNAFNEIDATDLDEIDALLEQNDLDTTNF